MYLTELEVEQALSQVRAAFPNLTQWEYSNERDEDYFGFTVGAVLSRPMKRTGCFRAIFMSPSTSPKGNGAASGQLGNTVIFGQARM